MHQTPNNSSVCIAVLPFENLSADSDTDYFSRGFVEDLITDLAHFSTMQVISSYTSRKIGHQTEDEISVADQLSVDYLLKGSLRRLGDQLRINTQLLDVAHAGSILWAERYDAPMDTVFEIQDDIVERVASALLSQIEKTMLAATRTKPLTSLAAYDCWLRGMDHLRQGTLAADREARVMFEQALLVDPNYSRAYAGLSLSYFNEWSCQLWEDWEKNEQNAFKYASQAVELNDSDHVTQMVLGRILLYRRQFDLAERHLDRSLALNTNDADQLAQLATCKAYLGHPREGEWLYRKALRLNPYRNIWYSVYGAMTYFVQHRYPAAIELALKGPLTEVWVDLPGYIASAYAHMGNLEKARDCLAVFIDIFQKEITAGQKPQADQVIDWLTLANPFKHPKDIDHLIDGLVMAGLSGRLSTGQKRQSESSAVALESTPGVFRKEAQLWRMRFEGKQVQIPEVKGFFDLARLLSQPNAEIHCTQLSQVTAHEGDSGAVIDEKARQAYEKRIRDLQTELEQARQNNDLVQAEKLSAELDQLLEHLSQSLGIGRRPRKFKAPAERARTAVTWRIRSAIRKIKASHPALGRHLSNAVHTGAYCSYTPEKDQSWQV